MVLTGLKLGADELLKKFDREAARRMYRTSLASLDCVEQVVKEEESAWDFSRSGHDARASPAFSNPLGKQRAFLRRRGTALGERRGRAGERSLRRALAARSFAPRPAGLFADSASSPEARLVPSVRDFPGDFPAPAAR